MGAELGDAALSAVASAIIGTRSTDCGQGTVMAVGTLRPSPGLSGRLHQIAGVFRRRRTHPTPP
ncbi:hypothetical protein [Streptomyces sp. B1I3]|uniref:hypothetical protein n=1 Tax=Streptomyces sp. B1I3 TaxID=3042264 RepID=UPI002787F825|nr:hypothetical protein [Streptomyces sp. B1I3]MDQ0791822.1 hypothetical protein [Streptomyces sp. B1I3]